VVDFELEKPVLIPLDALDAQKILFDVNNVTNGTVPHVSKGAVLMERLPAAWTNYLSKFNTVFTRLEYGDSFLTNLTVKTEVKLNRTLRDIFYQCRAKYKLLLDGQFLVFSPETFIQIRKGKIRSFPMKGTIDASIPEARNKILNDMKELSEHVTIVDLIRNDLSQIAKNVQVEKFRYLEEIKTADKTLLQVSSLISGDLADDYHAHLGDLLITLLPAGSISGAPKPKTLEIIRNVEEEKRGYYTGVFGLFDGEDLDSGVMIRFIERQGERYFYRSGGGITTQSEASKEYQEVIDKVYVPIA
jgi:para-aminobenzoate synthetase component 1